MRKCHRLTGSTQLQSPLAGMTAVDRRGTPAEKTVPVADFHRTRCPSSARRPASTRHASAGPTWTGPRTGVYVHVRVWSCGKHLSLMNSIRGCATCVCVLHDPACLYTQKHRVRPPRALLAQFNSSLSLRTRTGPRAGHQSRGSAAWAGNDRMAFFSPRFFPSRPAPVLLLRPPPLPVAPRARLHSN